MEHMEHVKKFNSFEGGNALLVGVRIKEMIERGEFVPMIEGVDKWVEMMITPTGKHTTGKGKKNRYIYRDDKFHTKSAIFKSDGTGKVNCSQSTFYSIYTKIVDNIVSKKTAFRCFPPPPLSLLQPGCSLHFPFLFSFFFHRTWSVNTSRIARQVRSPSKSS